MVSSFSSGLATAGLVGVIAVGSSASLAGQAGSGAQSPAQAAGLPGAEVVETFVATRVQKNWTGPKTPWGDPDIQGIFTSKDEANTPFERPDQWAGRRMDDITPKEFAEAIAERQQAAVERAPFAGGGEAEEGVAIAVPIHWFDNLAATNSRPWFVIDPPEGKVPALAPTARRVPRLGPNGGERDTYLDRDLGDRCISFAFRMPSIYGNSYQIVQTPDYVVLRREQLHDARVIALDGRPLPDVRSYEGHSRGHWEGQTLVVETTGFDERVAYRGYPATNLRVVERFTRIAPTKVEWSMTIDDPTVYVRPWTFSYPLTEDDSQPIYEYACHEGNFGLANILSAGRAGEKK
jgi:hypothetical protein